MSFIFILYHFQFNRLDASIIKVLIAGSECQLTSFTSTQLICKTGSYSKSSIKAHIQVLIENIGLSINVF